MGMGKGYYTYPLYTYMCSELVGYWKDDHGVLLAR